MPCPKSSPCPARRTLAYDECGPAGGAPLLFFHGAHSSRLDCHLFADDALARDLDLRATPDCRASFYPDGGHLSLVVHHARDTLAELADVAHDRLAANS